MENSYIAMYSYYDVPLYNFVDYLEVADFLKIPLFKVVYAIKHGKCLIYNGHKVKFKVEREIKSNYGRKVF